MRNKKLFFASLVLSLLSFFSFESASLAQEVAPASRPASTGTSLTQPQQENSTNPLRRVANGVSNAHDPLSIGPGDELEITVYGAPDLSTHARVESDGNILLPLVGLVLVAGETSSHAGRKIE